MVKIHHAEIFDHFYNLSEISNDAKYFKADFHVHTPGSKKDYMVGDRFYENVSINELLDIAGEKGLYPKETLELFISNEELKDTVMAELIVHEAISKKNLNLMVITDHNTLDWFPKIIQATQNYYKSRDLRGYYFSVLPGVEITCFGGTHVIAIFDEKSY